MRIWNGDYWLYLTSQFKAMTRELKTRLENVVSGRAVPSAANIEIGSARKLNAAVLFFDIRDSSSRSGLVALYTLDVVIPMVMRIVHDQDGYVEKNTGDGVMAIYTAMKDEKACEAALATAMTCFYVLEKTINPHLLQLNIPSVDARIGIDFGEILVARVGVPTGSATQERSFLTAIGHTANIACSLQEQGGTNQIWVGDDIKKRAPAGWQQFFKAVQPQQWKWTYNLQSGGSIPYPAWHFDARRPDPVSPTRASEYLTSPTLSLTPSSSILSDLLRIKKP